MRAEDLAELSSAVQPRPPSPAHSVASFASTTTSYRRKARGRVDSIPKLQQPSRFESEDIPIEEAIDYVQRPHRTWDSASRELARLESQRQKLEDDSRSCASSVSAYSVKSTVSVAASSSSVRRAPLGNLLTRSPPPQQAPDLTVGGNGIGGFSFVAPRRGNAGASSSPAVEQSPSVSAGRLGVSSVVSGLTSNGGSRAGSSPQLPVGAAGGRSGIRQSNSSGSRSESSRGIVGNANPPAPIAPNSAGATVRSSSKPTVNGRSQKEAHVGGGGAFQFQELQISGGGLSVSGAGGGKGPTKAQR